jgi:hypothetical protein
MQIILPPTEPTLDEIAEQFILNDNGIYVYKKEGDWVINPV